ncbi:Hypothetical predicted protein [Mytilus galloprovincialis]|uniref:Uncharacterized protein n=1 Tax=Mytilus galloprovincialis TaxID=29158 RepID=A0A8B6E7U8_MYTGA|nr:Hypothetical predicted protein [Mytilus galloprovincialis]
MNLVKPSSSSSRPNLEYRTQEDDVPEEHKERLEQLFYMYCHPDSGLLTKEGFISVLRGLHLDPTNTFIESIYTEHNKDGNDDGISLYEFKSWMKNRWNTKDEMENRLFFKTESIRTELSAIDTSGTGILDGKDLVTFLHGEDETLSARDSVRKGLATARGGPRQMAKSTGEIERTPTGDQY